MRQQRRLVRAARVAHLPLSLQLDQLAHHRPFRQAQLLNQLVSLHVHRQSKTYSGQLSALRVLSILTFIRGFSSQMLSRPIPRIRASSREYLSITDTSAGLHLVRTEERTEGYEEYVLPTGVHRGLAYLSIRSSNIGAFTSEAILAALSAASSAAL